MTSDYWWTERLADDAFDRGSRDAKAGKVATLPQNFDYMAGYNTVRLLAGGA